MRNLLLVIISLTGLNLFSQISFVGFDQPVCGQTVNSVYTYTNYPSGSHGGGYTIYRDGTVIKTDVNFMGAAWCSGLFFLNDSTGFIVVTTGGGSAERVFKTSDYGQTWIPSGAGMPEFIGFYAVNAHYGYLLTRLFNSEPMISLNLCSDLPGVSKLIFTDNAVNSDKYIRDTLMNNSLCNIDSLNIFIKNGTDTITYHINNSIPIIGGSVTADNCAGNSINVPYSIGTIFNPVNIFTAELSDGNGLFVSPVSIGTLSATNSGTINAIIPASTPPGNGYKIRVVSSDPFYIGKDNGAKIRIENGIPSISITNSSSLSVCVGSTVILTGNGSSTYTWSTGVHTSSIQVAPSVTTTYSLNSSNTCGAASETISVNIDSSCSAVMPGDVNKDGRVNNLDVLELGLHFNQSGPPRATISNNWQTYDASNWSGIISNGANLCNSDCNGDGIINIDDTLAIFANYNYVNNPTSSYINPELIIKPDGPINILLGAWSSASIYLGDSINEVIDINGLAFTVEFMNGIDSIYIEYEPSFLNAANQNIYFKKTYSPPSGMIYTATTHTSNINVSGYGKIAKIHFKTVTTISPNQTLWFWLNDGYKSDSQGVLTPLKTGQCDFWVTDFVGIKEISKPISISLMPNPANGLITVNSSHDIQKIEIINTTGQLLLSRLSNGQKEELRLEGFSNGIYFMRIILTDGRNTTKKMIVNH